MNTELIPASTNEVVIANAGELTRETSGYPLHLVTDKTGEQTKAKSAPVRYMPQLDGLRALAVAAVAWWHWAPPEYHFQIPWGDLGVQLFFVLSGFLITAILWHGRSEYQRLGQRGFLTLRRFYMRRFLRIFPLYYAVVLMTALIGIKSVRETFFWNIAYLSNFYLFLRGEWRGPISHFWSLAVEEQFYLFPRNSDSFARNFYIVDNIQHVAMILIFVWIIANASRGIPGSGGRFLAHRVLIFLGTISYGLYVLHMFAPLFMMKLVDFQAPGNPRCEPGFAFGFNDTLTVGGATFSRLFFEGKVNDLK
jgi:peptidoglycan/LPS O-acetylase OafA/YrhL